MKRTYACVGVMFLAVFVAFAQEPKAQVPDDGTVTMVFDKVELADVVRMMTRIASVNIKFDPTDAKFRESTSVNVHDKHWKPVLTSVLEQHGLLLVEDSQEARSYSIVRAQSKEIVARLRAAQEAVILADAVLADLNAGNLVMAKERLTKYRDRNAEMVRTIQEKQGVTEETK